MYNFINIIRKLKHFIRSIANIYFLNKNKNVLIHPWLFAEITLIKYLKQTKMKKQNLYIIGGYHGEEINELISTKKIKHITVFEPVVENFKVLKESYYLNNNLTFVNAAVSNKNGLAHFNEVNIAGSGSILKPNAFSKKSWGTKVKKKFLVSTVKLDTYCKINKSYPDILWIDVQGLELEVLKSAKSILKKVGIILVEISIFNPTYYKAAIFSEIVNFLEKYSFKPMQLGTDFYNGTGNALFFKNNVTFFNFRQ